MAQTQQTSQRAAVASLLGLGVQSLIALALLILWLWSGASAVAAGALYAVAGVPLWICLWLIYQQHKLERQENLEAERLARSHGEESSIFETSADDLSIARRRLDILYKWGLPITSLITALFLMGAGVWFFLAHNRIVAATGLNAGVSAVALGFIFAGLAFACFVFCRYVAAMGVVDHWRLLRAGAGYLMGMALISAALSALSFFLAQSELIAAMAYLALSIAVFMALIGLEMGLNFILDFYRPRQPSEPRRPAFDSRLLALLTSPESVAKTINEAINYQFGFEITRSWFWQLLSRSFGGLILLGLVILIIVSCFVVVPPYQRALVLHSGKIASQPLSPGVHLKLPWPLATVQHYNVTRTRVLTIGPHSELKEDTAILWSNAHAVTEDEAHAPYIVAAPIDLVSRLQGGGDVSPVFQDPITDQGDPNSPAATKPGEPTADTPLQSLTQPASAAQKGGDQLPGAQGDTPFVSLLEAQIVIEYRIGEGNLLEYVRGVQNPDQLLKNFAQSIVSRFLLRRDIDAWIGGARAEAGEQLRRLIQDAVHDAKLGFHIINVSLAGIHPPQPVAEAFHKVVSAYQVKMTKIQEAKRKAVQTLAQIAGSQERAQLILEEIEELERMMRTGADPEKIALQERKLERLLLNAGGETATLIAQARAFKWKRINTAAGQAIRFQSRLTAYKKAPRLYKVRLYFDALAKALARARKFIIASDREQLTIRGDFKEINRAFDQLDLSAPRNPNN